MYNKKISLRKHKASGRIYFYDPEHPLANKSGMIYYHRHIISLFLKRWISSKEIVHHIDGDNTHNAIENLIIVSASEHSRIHNPLIRIPVICSTCGKEFVPKELKGKYCSSQCVYLSQRRFEIEKEELAKRIWEQPATEIAKIFNVSSKSIEKRCRKFKIKTPPRGYWQKLYAGKILGGVA